MLIGKHDLKKEDMWYALIEALPTEKLKMEAEKNPARVLLVVAVTGVRTY